MSYTKQYLELSQMNWEMEDEDYQYNLWRAEQAVEEINQLTLPNYGEEEEN